MISQARATLARLLPQVAEQAGLSRAKGTSLIPLAELMVPAQTTTTTGDDIRAAIEQVRRWALDQMPDLLTAASERRAALALLDAGRPLPGEPAIPTFRTAVGGILETFGDAG